MPPLTPLDIQHKEFTKAMRGYAMHEVDTFLDQVTEEFTRMQDEIARLREQASSAAPPQPVQVQQAPPPPPPPQAQPVPAEARGGAEAMSRVAGATNDARATAVDVKGLADTLEKAGLAVERLEITQEANSDASLAVPILAAYVQNNPDLKAIGLAAVDADDLLRTGLADLAGRGAQTDAELTFTADHPVGADHRRRLVS
jgi:DivIVA domain-containing protein